MSSKMRTWGTTPSTEMLARIPRAADQFRERWASIRPPWGCDFDGTVHDVRAIDYLQYEGIEFPSSGLEGAGLIAGEVLRRAAGLAWVVSSDRNWYLSTHEDVHPGVVVCPLVRVREIEFAGVPQCGRFMKFLVRAAVDCLPFVDDAARSALGEILRFDDGYVEELADAVRQARSSSSLT